MSLTNPNYVVDTTFTVKNISSAASVYAYTAPASYKIIVEVYLDSVAGGGDYVAYLTKQLVGAGTAYPILGKTTVTAAAGDTAFGLGSISIHVKTGDVVNVMVDGLAGDTSISGKIRIIVDNYSVFDAAADDVSLAAAAVTAIDTELSAEHGSGNWTDSAGAGATEFVYTVTDETSGDAIADVHVWVTTDISGDSLVASGYSDDFGDVTFYLDPGAYYFWRKHSGWNFQNPDLETVV